MRINTERAERENGFLELIRGEDFEPFFLYGYLFAHTNHMQFLSEEIDSAYMGTSKELRFIPLRVNDDDVPILAELVCTEKSYGHIKGRIPSKEYISASCDLYWGKHSIVLDAGKPISMTLDVGLFVHWGISR